MTTYHVDLKRDLESALSSLRSSIDTLWFIEQDLENGGGSLSDAEVTAHISTVKTGINACMSTLQGCGVDAYVGTNAPDDQISTLRIVGLNSIPTGEATTLSASADYTNYKGIITEENILETVTWSSSDGSIASINSSTGLVFAGTPGNVTITARAGDGTVSSVPMIVT